MQPKCASDPSSFSALLFVLRAKLSDRACHTTDITAVLAAIAHQLATSDTSSARAALERLMREDCVRGTFLRLDAPRGVDMSLQLSSLVLQHPGVAAEQVAAAVDVALKHIAHHALSATIASTKKRKSGAGIVTSRTVVDMAAVVAKLIRFADAASLARFIDQLISSSSPDAPLVLGAFASSHFALSAVHSSPFQVPMASLRWAARRR